MKVYILTAKMQYTVNELQIIAVYNSFETAEKATLELGYKKTDPDHRYYKKGDWIAEVEEWEVEK